MLDPHSEPLPGTLSRYDFFTAVWRVLTFAREHARELARERLSGGPGTTNTPSLSRMPGTAGPLEQEPLRLKVSPELSFPASEVAELTGPDTAGRFTLTTHLPGLHGALSPLPSSYVTEVLQGLDDAPQLAGFLDLFHHRLLGLLYRGVVQHQPERMWTGDGQDDFSQVLAILSHQTPDELTPDAPMGQRDFSGLLAEPHPTADGLELLLSRLTGLPVEVEPLVGRYVSLPDSTLPRLGESEPGVQTRGRPAMPYRLGHSLLGDRLYDRSQRFGVRFELSSWEQLTRLQPGGSDHSALRAQLRQYAGPLLDVVLIFRLPTALVPETSLGGEFPAVLGSDLPIGTSADPWLEVRVELDAFPGAASAPEGARDRNVSTSNVIV